VPASEHEARMYAEWLFGDEVEWASRWNDFGAVSSARMDGSQPYPWDAIAHSTRIIEQ